MENVDFFTAIRDGDIVKVQEFLAIVPRREFVITHKSRKSPLHVAAVHGQLEIMAMLLQQMQEVSVDYQDRRGQTALMNACASGRKSSNEIVRLLLKHDARVDLVNESGKSAIHMAVCSGHLITTLLDAGAYCDNKDRDGNTPLHFAAANGHVRVTHSLISKGAFVRNVNRRGQMAIHPAAALGQTAVVQILLNSGVHVDVEDKEGTPLLAAARNGHVGTVQTLLAANARYAAVDSKSNSVLHIAVQHNHVELVRLLLNREDVQPALLHGVNGDGRTPFFLAAGERNANHPAIVQMLLDAKASVVSRNGDCALYAAAKDADKKQWLVELLIQHGVDATHQNLEGNTPLHSLAKMNYCTSSQAESCLRVLLGARAQINHTNRYGVTPLHRACEDGHFLVVKHFLAAGADPLQVDKNGNTVWHFAAHPTIPALHRGAIGAIFKPGKKNGGESYEVTVFVVTVSAPYHAIRRSFEVCASREGVISRGDVAAYPPPRSHFYWSHSPPTRPPRFPILVFL